MEKKHLQFHLVIFQTLSLRAPSMLLLAVTLGDICLAKLRPPLLHSIKDLLIERLGEGFKLCYTRTLYYLVIKTALRAVTATIASFTSVATIATIIGEFCITIKHNGN